MMPFSPEFLRELKGQATTEPAKVGGGIHRSASNTSISSKCADVLPTEPIEGVDRMFHAFKLSDSCVLVGCEDETFNMFISGFCNVVALKGDVCINGYTISASSSKHRICNPIWLPAYHVCDASSSSVANTKAVSSYKTPSKQASTAKRTHIEAYLEAYDIKCSVPSTSKLKNSAKTSNLFGEFNVLFAVEGLSSADQEWLMAADDHSLYKELPTSSSAKVDNRGILTVHTTPAISFKKTSIVRVGSAMLGNFSAMNSAKADCMTVPSSWVSASDKLTTDYSNNQTVNVAICGAKGVGKSTCLRYTANKLLSASEKLFSPQGPTGRLSLGGAYANKKASTAEDVSTGVAMWASRPSVCIIDCDLGQPELSVPGSVSLHVVCCSENADGITTGAFLSAPHLNMQPPDRSYFLGDVTSKHEPQLVLRYVQLLLQRYQEIVAEVAATQEATRKAATKKFVNANAFNALMLDADSDAASSGSDEEDKPSSKATNSAGASSSPRMPPLPLVINLDGYVKNMGAEVLESLLRMASPTHVMHICTDRDRALLPLEAILNVSGATKDSPDNDSREPSSSTSKLNPSNSTSNVVALGEAKKEKCCELLLLEPGRYYTTPRLAAVDLRSLRLVAYFLRVDAGIRPFVRDSTAPAGLTRSNSLGNIPQRTSSAGNLASLDTNASSSSAQSNDTVTVRNGSVGHPQGLLALRLLSVAPYAVPFSCVSLCSVPANGDLPARLVLAAMNAAVVGIVTYSTKNEELCDMFKSGKKRLRLGEQEFELSCPTTYPVAHCLGLGVIRAVDVPNQRILLTTPVPEDVLLAAGARLCLLKGNGLQLPASLTYAPSFPCFPYMSSESTGEGSAQLRTRNNVKRRAQHQ